MTAFTRPAGRRARTKRARTFLPRAVLLVLFAAPQAGALPDGLEAEEYVIGLEFPVAMAVAPDGLLLVTEKDGNLRAVRNGVLDPDPVFRVDPLTENERGLLGVQLMPDFATSGEFVITYTPRADIHSIYLSRLRWTGEAAEAVADPWLKLPSSPDTDRHYGGNVRFDSAGRMYISLSDLDDPATAQQRGKPAGSILRYENDLSIPDDNPFPGSPIFAYGMRNTFDFDIGPDDTIYGAENGHHHHDELNRIVKGGNYGWPLVHGVCDHVPVFEVCDDVAMLQPLHEFRDRTGPTGLVIYDGQMMPELSGDILYGGWHSGQLHHFERRGLDDVEISDSFFVIPGGPHPRKPGDDRQHLGDYGIVDVDVAHDGAILVMVTGVNVGTIYRIAPSDQILNPDLVVEEGDPRVSDDDLCQVSHVGARGVAGLSALILFGAGLLFLGRRGAGNSMRRALRRMLFGSGLSSLFLWHTELRAEPVDEQERVRYGAKVGLNQAFINGDNDFVTEWATGFAAGVAARLPFGAHFAIQPELFYAQKGTGLVGTDARLSSHYVTLPVLAEGLLPLGIITPRIFAGPAFSVLLHANSGDQNVTKRLRRFELGLLGGVGIDFEVASRLVTLDVQFERALTELYASGAVPETVQYETNWNNVLYVMVGFMH